MAGKGFTIDNLSQPLGCRVTMPAFPSSNTWYWYLKTDKVEGFGLCFGLRVELRRQRCFGLPMRLKGRLNSFSAVERMALHCSWRCFVHWHALISPLCAAMEFQRLTKSLWWLHEHSGWCTFSRVLLPRKSPSSWSSIC